MTDTSGQKPEDQASIAPDTTEAEAAAGTVNEALAKEVADMRDRLLRTLAEMENLRKRTEREVADARSFGIAKFARDILDIADNMHRALEAVPDEARSADNAGLKALVEGVELTERSLLKALESNGVRRFEPAGEKFNPNLHQAMYEVPDSSVPAGTIVQVIQPGYMIGERVLRPAMIAVAKAAPKAADAS
jgi:molecular chaperone GrpE